MNCPVKKLLKEVITCLLITELNRVRRKRRRGKTMTNRVFRRDKLLGAMMRRLNKRDREKNKNTIETLRHRKEGKITCNA